MMNLKVKECISNQFIEVRGYILEKGDDALVIDPGFEIQSFLDQLKGKSLIAILLTHGHFDHIAGLNELSLHYPNTPVYIAEADRSLLYHCEENLSNRFQTPVEINSEIQILNLTEGNLKLNHFNCQVIEIGGHTRGSMVFVFDHVLFSGDTLMKDTVGVVNVPGQDLTVLTDRIASKILTLPEETEIYSGHTEKTTVAREKSHNFYFKEL